MSGKIKAIIERGADGGFAITAQVNGLIGSGSTEAEAREDFMAVLEEQAEFYEERHGTAPWWRGAEVEFRSAADAGAGPAKRVTVVIERAADGGYCCYMEDELEHFGLQGYGDTVEEAKANLAAVYAEMCAIEEEEGRTAPALEFVYRLAPGAA